MENLDLNLNVNINTQNAINGLDNIENKAQEVVNKVGEIGKKTEETTTSVGGLGNAFQGVFQNALQDSQKLGGNLGDVAKGVKQAIPVVKNLNSTALSGLTGIRAALASLGIGAIITGVSLLVSWLIKVVKESKELEKASRELNKTIAQGASNAAGQIVKLQELSKKYRELGDSAQEKKKFLKDYADEIKQTGINIDSVAAAEDVLKNNTDKYIEALKKRAIATAAYNLAVKTYEEYLEKLPEKREAVTKAAEESERSFWQKLTTTIIATSDAANAAEMASGVATAQTVKNVENAQKSLDSYSTDMMAKFEKLFNEYLKYSQEANEVLGGTIETAKATAKELYEAWAKANPEKVIAGSEALAAWEKQLEEEGKRAAKLAEIRKSLRNVTVPEEEVEEESPKDYLTRQQERKRAVFENQKELLDIEVLSTKEKNNALYDLEMDRLDSEGEYLQQMRDLTIEDSEEREELDRQIEENEQQKEILRKKRKEQHKKDVAEEIQMYAQAAQAIAGLFGVISQAEEDRINRQVENGEISEEEAKKQFETVKGWQYAETWINTLAGMTAALTSPVMQSMGIPGWIAAAAQAATLLASGIAQTVKIKNTQFGTGGSSAGGGNVPNVGVTPMEVMEDIQASPSVLQDSQTPKDQRVYILEGDIQESNKRVEVREANSTF